MILKYNKCPKRLSCIFFKLTVLKINSFLSAAFFQLSKLLSCVIQTFWKLAAHGISVEDRNWKEEDPSGEWKSIWNKLPGDFQPWLT